ncbi:hypothetical protein H6G48_16220 [Microcystis flos-aquae FACHB-1344]|uniref:Uncharacterized protein n=1 Tax=Microcystis flos-aquae FACHB-1344 TaxID=2692899 RepID=A0ABR8HX95_9CHRO|nr:hypothetical protein [Microcystis sp. M179S2]MBD2623139.1 hypothetical protein [Microcystis flos-aquae FACHB-1344]MCA2701656.1 hypothetical protein [Microcystis sp. M179S2]
MINSLLPEIREGMRLWSPQGLNEEVSLEETSENLILCGQALTDFLSLKIDLTDYLEIVESCGVDVDDYLDVISFNLHDFL